VSVVVFVVLVVVPQHVAQEVVNVLRTEPVDVMIRLMGIRLKLEVMVVMVLVLVLLLLRRRTGKADLVRRRHFQQRLSVRRQRVERG
jgi:hypothetical protein